MRGVWLVGLSTLTLCGCGGAPAPSATPDNTAAAPSQQCAYEGPMVDAVLRSDEGGVRFGHVAGARGHAELEVEGGAPRLAITASAGGWTLIGYAAVGDAPADPALRTARATKLVDGVTIAPGYQPVVVDGGPGQLELGLPSGAFAADEGFTFAAPARAWLPCDQVSPAIAEPNQSADDVRVELGLAGDLPRKTFRRDRPVTVRVTPGGAALVTFRAVDLDDLREVVVVAQKGEHTRISVVDEGAMIDGWVVADDVEEVGLPAGGSAFGGATGTPYVGCTTAAEEALWLELPDGGRTQVGTLAAGTAFLVPGRATTFDGPIPVVPPSDLALRVEREAHVTIAPSAAPTCR